MPTHASPNELPRAHLDAPKIKIKKVKERYLPSDPKGEKNRDTYRVSLLLVPRNHRNHREGTLSGMGVRTPLTGLCIYEEFCWKGEGNAGTIELRLKRGLQSFQGG